MNTANSGQFLRDFADVTAARAQFEKAQESLNGWEELVMKQQRNYDGVGLEKLNRHAAKARQAANEAWERYIEKSSNLYDSEASNIE